MKDFLKYAGVVVCECLFSEVMMINEKKNRALDRR